MCVRACASVCECKYYSDDEIGVTYAVLHVNWRWGILYDNHVLQIETFLFSVFGKV